MSPGLDGRRFGRYEVIEELGHGGQGSVYRARDTQLGRDVALKILGSGAALSEAARLRFLREAEVASRLDHPGLCAVYEFGEHEGVPFIAMRYVRGRPLDRDIADTRASASSPTTEYFDFDDEADDPERSSPDVETMSLGRERHDAVLRVFELVARALHVAHEAGLVHRDIKPANIMIGDDDQPVVLDFGLAREESGDGPLLTATGDVLGTPAYMAPEQLDPKAALLDRRCDVWGLGVTLFEVLCSRRPFEAATRQGLFHEILVTEAPDLRAHCPEASADLAAVVRTAIEKDPDQRYQTALDFAHDLAALRRGDAIAVRPLRRSERVLRWVRRHPERTLTIATIVVLLAGLLSMWSWSRAQSRDAELRELALESETRERERAESESATMARAQRDLEIHSQLLRIFQGRLATMDFARSKSSLTRSPAQETRRVLDAFRRYGLAIDDSRDLSEVADDIRRVRARAPELGLRLLWALQAATRDLEVGEFTRAAEWAAGSIPAWAGPADHARWRGIAERQPELTQLTRRVLALIEAVEDDPWRRSAWQAYLGGWRDGEADALRPFLDLAALGERDALDILWLADLVRLLSRDVAPVDLVELALWKRPELVDAHLMRADACLPSFRDETKVWEGMVRDLMAGRFRGIEGVDFPRARHHAQVAVALAPGHEATWLELGFLEFMAARFDEADQVFQRVIALGDVSGLARLMNCFRLLSLHETERAIAAAESILEDHDEGNLAVEPALEILSKIAPAERCLPLCDAFLERFPGHVVATFNRGRLRLVLGRVEDAGQDFREAMDRAEGTDALHRHGRALRGLRQFDMAVRAFDLALAGEPGHRPTLQELGQLVASEASVDLGEDRLRDLMQRSADADLLLTAARFGARLILSSEVVEDRLDAAWVAMVASERRSVDTRDAPEDTARELRARALAVMESLVRTQGARLRDARSWPNSLTRLDAASDLDETERAAWLRFWRSLD